MEDEALVHRDGVVRNVFRIIFAEGIEKILEFVDTNLICRIAIISFEELYWNNELKSKWSDEKNVLK